MLEVPESQSLKRMLGIFTDQKPPPRSARTKCSVAPPSSPYSAAVLESLLHIHSPISQGALSHVTPRFKIFLTSAFLRRSNVVVQAGCPPSPLRAL